VEEEQKRVAAMRDRFEKTILEQVPGTVVNGAQASRLSNTSSVSFNGIESQSALMLLDRHRICCSAGSACRTGSAEASHVLRAMKVSEDRARGTLRFSFGRFNLDSDLEQACNILPRVIEKLRSLSSPAKPDGPVM